MKVYREFVQYSPEFWEHRRGKPSTSEFHRFIGTDGKLRRNRKGDGLSQGAMSYVHELIADRIRFDPPFLTEQQRPAPSMAVREGNEREAESRRWYELKHSCDVLQVGGFESDCGRFWCSPDGLIQKDGTYVGGIELKNPQPKAHVEWMTLGAVPEDHMAQVHGALWLAHLDFWVFQSYCPPFRAVEVVTTPNEYTRNLGAALEEFYATLLIEWKAFQELNR